MLGMLMDSTPQNCDAVRGEEFEHVLAVVDDELDAREKRLREREFELRAPTEVAVRPHQDADARDLVAIEPPLGVLAVVLAPCRDDPDVVLVGERADEFDPLRERPIRALARVVGRPVAGLVDQRHEAVPPVRVGERVVEVDEDDGSHTSSPRAIFIAAFFSPSRNAMFTLISTPSIWLSVRPRLLSSPLTSRTMNLRSFGGSAPSAMSF